MESSGQSIMKNIYHPHDNDAATVIRNHGGYYHQNESIFVFCAWWYTHETNYYWRICIMEWIVITFWEER